MLKQVLNYKHDTTSYYGDTSKLTEVKSKHYKYMYYVLDGDKLITTIGLDTIATDNHKLSKALVDGATTTELEMWQDEMSV
jgi:hypothetical protein